MRLRLQLACAGLSDRGLARPTNQDRFLIAGLPGPAGAARGYLLAVADGVGGASGGETASTLAIESVEQASLGALGQLAAEPPDGPRISAALRATFRHADLRLAEEIARSPELQGMATTLTVALCTGRRLFVAHAGDSRAYLLRGGALRQLTSDQTVAEELARRGLIDRDAIADNPFRQILSDFVGGGVAKLHVEIQGHELWGGDTLLLCSDGLTGMVPDEEIARILGGASAPGTACEHLVYAANAKGGHDNVTVVVAQVAIGP
jgi:protein phosphatase